jgi:hypothetical protein
MTRNEATDLAIRIAQSWQRGLATSIWEEELLELDHGRAGTTIARLRRSETHPPNIARFHDMYNTIDADNHHEQTHPNCATCDNTGWQPHVEHIDNEEYTTGVTPCRCPWGTDRRQIHADIIRRNTNELTRLHPTRNTTPQTRQTPASAPYDDTNRF